MKKMKKGIKSSGIIFDSDARGRLLEGMDKLNRAVGITLGPGGRNVILEDDRHSLPFFSKDGITVGREVMDEDRARMFGILLLNEAGRRTARYAGDGTTTSTVLCNEIYCRGLKYIESGCNAVMLKRGIDRATVEVLRYLGEHSYRDLDLQKVWDICMVSSNHDESISDLLYDIYDKIGVGGIIKIDEGVCEDVSYSITEGLEISRGFVSNRFCRGNDNRRIIYNDCRVLIQGDKIESISSILPALDYVRKRGVPLLVMASDYSDEVLDAILLNVLNGALDVVCIKTEGYGERKVGILEDISLVTGGKYIGSDTMYDLDNIDDEILGLCSKVIVTENTTTFVTDVGDNRLIDDRINFLLKESELVNSEYEKEKYIERATRLRGNICMLRVGGSTEVEAEEKKLRIDDCIRAVGSSIEEGILPGGGVSLLRSSVILDVLEDRYRGIIHEDELLGIKVVRDSLSAPILYMAKNCGIDGMPIVVNLIENYDNDFDRGYNFLTNAYENFYESGIIDSAKVVRISLENAASIAGMFLTTGCIIYNKDSDK